MLRLIAVAFAGTITSRWPTDLGWYETCSADGNRELPRPCGIGGVSKSNTVVHVRDRWIHD